MPIRDNDETRKAYYQEYNKGWYIQHVYTFTTEKVRIKNLL